MAQAEWVYWFSINSGESIQLWIHGYEQHSFVAFDLKPGLEQLGGVFTGEKLFISYHVVGVGEHVDVTVGYTLSFTNQSSEELIAVSGFLLNLFEPVANWPL
jgi:hypothetical protein